MYMHDSLRYPDYEMFVWQLFLIPFRAPCCGYGCNYFNISLTFTFPYLLLRRFVVMLIKVSQHQVQNTFGFVKMCVTGRSGRGRPHQIYISLMRRVRKPQKLRTRNFTYILVYTICLKRLSY